MTNPSDFPWDNREWYRYSLGNPDMWRRIVYGRLFYACARTGIWFESGPGVEHVVHSAGNFAEAIRQCEELAASQPLKGGQ